MEVCNVSVVAKSHGLLALYLILHPTLHNAGLSARRTKGARLCCATSFSSSCISCHQDIFSVFVARLVDLGHILCFHSPHSCDPFPVLPNELMCLQHGENQLSWLGCVLFSCFICGLFGVFFNWSLFVLFKNISTKREYINFCPKYLFCIRDGYFNGVRCNSRTVPCLCPHEHSCMQIRKAL